MRTINLVTYSLLTVFSFLLLIWIIPTQTPESAGYGIAPSVLPNVLASVMLISSAFLLLQSIKNKDEKRPNPLPVSAWLHLLKYGAVFFIAFPLMECTGFLSGSMLVLAALQYLSGQRNLLIIIAVSVIISFAGYFALWHGMGVDLPHGLFF